MKSQFVEELLESVYEKLDESPFDGLDDNVKKLAKSIISLDPKTIMDITSLPEHKIQDFIESWIEHIAESQSKAKNWKDSFKEFTGKSKISEKESLKLS